MSTLTTSGTSTLECLTRSSRISWLSSSTSGGTGFTLSASVVRSERREGPIGPHLGLVHPPEWQPAPLGEGEPRLLAAPPSTHRRDDLAMQAEAVCVAQQAFNLDLV